jgi:hypothetical protein
VGARTCPIFHHKRDTTQPLEPQAQRSASVAAATSCPADVPHWLLQLRAGLQAGGEGGFPAVAHHSRRRWITSTATPRMRTPSLERYIGS